jgi:hypothetical protein
MLTQRSSNQPLQITIVARKAHIPPDPLENDLLPIQTPHESPLSNETPEVLRSFLQVFLTVREANSEETNFFASDDAAAFARVVVP